MKHIEINIGKACNNQCRFCMSSGADSWDKALVELDVLRGKLRDYRGKGYDSVGFLGGEISIHPRLIEIFSYAREVGFLEIQAVSNGMRFADNNFASRAVMSGMTRINISVHSHEDSVEDYLTQVPGWLRKKIAAIENLTTLHDEGLLKNPISINIVVNSKNYSTIVETAIFFIGKGVRDIRINFVRLSPNVAENWNDLRISYTQFLPYLKKLIYLSLKYKIRITFDAIPYCILYRAEPKDFHNIVGGFIWEDIDHITQIDWINNNEVFNWQDRKRDDLKTQPAQCVICTKKDVCQWIWTTYIDIYGGEEFCPISQT